MGLLAKLSGTQMPALIALDISSTRVKLLELSGARGQLQIKAYASEPLPPEAISNHQIADPEAAAGVIKRVIERSGTKAKHAALAVTGSSVISKIIDMPATLSEDEIENQIGFEADQYIPYPIEEVSLDFQILGPSSQGSDMNSVLLAACRRDDVETRVAAVEMAGLKAQMVDVEAYALQNACQLLIDQLPPNLDEQEQAIAVVDFGATTTSTIILVNREAVYTREQNFGGVQLEADIQRQYELEPEQALAKLRNGDLPDGFLQDVLPRFAEHMAQQIDRALQFFYSGSSTHDHIHQIVLVGGCALLPGIDQLVRQHLDTPVQIGNPLAGMQASGAARRNKVEAEAPALMVAAGLALRGVG